MNVIGFSGSPRKDANTDRLVAHILAGAQMEGAETEFIRIADLNIKGCISCYYCKSHDACSIKDDMQELRNKIHSADAVVIGSPVYMGQMSGQTKIFVDRLLPLLNADFSTRLKKHPALISVFTQGQPNIGMFKAYMENTHQMMGFLGFKPLEIVIAGGTREKSDVNKQTALVTRAKALGAGLLKTP